MSKFFRVFLFLYTLQCIDCQITCEKAFSYMGCTTETEGNILQRGIVSDDAELNYISLVSCQLTEIQAESFEGLANLLTLDVSFNFLTTIQLGVLDNLNNVQTFNLSYNTITELPLGIFDQMTSLTSLDISNNQLSELVLGILDPMVYLRTLYLENNKLQGLPLGIFDKSRGLYEIDLSLNDMSTLPLGIFDSVPQIGIIDMTSSNFNDMPSGIFDENKALKELYLSSNGITVIPDLHFNDLTHLSLIDLSNNQLSQLADNTFARQTNLKYLNLSMNILIDATPVAYLQRLSTLDLSKNKLTYVPEFNTPSLKYLDISYNRITNFGSNVGMNIPRKLTTFKLHRNPWQCACLEQVLGILRRRRIAYEFSTYFNGKKPVCLVIKDKNNRCFRDNSKDQMLNTQYNAVLKKYPGV